MMIHNLRKSPISLFLIVFISAFLLQLITPWWVVVVIGFATGIFSLRHHWYNFLIVFVAIGLLWLLASVYITLTNSPVLIPRIAGLFGLPSGWMVYGITVLTGALPAALATFGASLLKTG